MADPAHAMTITDPRDLAYVRRLAIEGILDSVTDFPAGHPRHESYADLIDKLVRRAFLVYEANLTVGSASLSNQGVECLRGIIDYAQITNGERWNEMMGEQTLGQPVDLEEVKDAGLVLSAVARARVLIGDGKSRDGKRKKRPKSDPA